jgi:hypothetical protein
MDRKYNLSDYRRGIVLGEGTYGVVYEAFHPETNEVSSLFFLQFSFPLCIIQTHFWLDYSNEEN